MKTSERTTPRQLANARLLLGAVLATTCILCVAGCQCMKGYRFGTVGLYNSDIKTVYVQMVEADTYRTGFGERLTEAVCKKITEQTPYQLGLAEDADSLLAIHLTAESQTITAYNRYDDTREKNVSLTATAVWKDLHSAKIIGQISLPAVSMEDGVVIESNSYLVAEMGQSSATAQQEAIEKMAEQIVGLMETAW